MKMLEIQGLDVAYGESQVLWDVSLQVPDGDVVCLMGRNGVGKTTLLKSIMGLLPVRAGRITFDGADLGGLRPEERAAHGIGYVPRGARSSRTCPWRKISASASSVGPG